MASLKQGVVAPPAPPCPAPPTPITSQPLPCSPGAPVASSREQQGFHNGAAGLGPFWARIWGPTLGWSAVLHEYLLITKDSPFPTRHSPRGSSTTSNVDGDAAGPGAGVTKKKTVGGQVPLTQGGQTGPSGSLSLNPTPGPEGLRSTP